MLASHIKQINNQELLHGYPSHHFRGLKTNTINLTHPGYSRQQRTTGRRPAHSLKVNELLDCFSSFDPNAVHSSSAVARWSGLSFGSPCALAIGDRVTSARLRPRFRHVHRRSRFVRWQHNPGTQIKTPTAALRPAAFVVRQLAALFLRMPLLRRTRFDEINGCSITLDETRKTILIGLRGLDEVIELA